MPRKRINKRYCKWGHRANWDSRGRCLDCHRIRMAAIAAGSFLPAGGGLCRNGLHPKPYKGQCKDCLKTNNLYAAQRARSTNPLQGPPECLCGHLAIKHDQTDAGRCYFEDPASGEPCDCPTLRTRPRLDFTDYRSRPFQEWRKWGSGRSSKKEALRRKAELSGLVGRQNGPKTL